MDRRVVIWNPESRRASEFTGVLEHLKTLDGFDVRITSSGEESQSIAARAVAEKAELIVAAGGDGTIHKVVNGMGAGSGTRLHVLPLGTGNDFCRSMGLPLEPAESLDCLPNCPSRPVDLLELRMDDLSRLCVNLASGGNSVRVTEMLTDELKANWGPWVFLRGAFQFLSHLENYRARVRFDDEVAEDYELWNFLAANGRYGAGGIDVAPEARPDDGLMDVVLVKGGNAMDFAAVTAEFFMGRYLDDPNVTFRQCRKVEFDVNPTTRMVCDGEILESSQFRFRVIPRAIEVQVPRISEGTRSSEGD